MARTRTTKYPLHDKDGRLRATHEHVKNPETGEKDCYWRGPNGEKGLNGTPLADLPLYGIHEMDEDAALTILVEGQPACDALANALKRTGVRVVGTVTGAGGTPSQEVLEDLRGHEVVLWPDTDDPGRKLMDRIAKGLQGIAAVVRSYTWHEAPEVWVEGKNGEPKLKAQDAADHPAVKSGDEKALGRLLNDLCGAPEYAPPSEEGWRTPNPKGYRGG